MYIGVDGRRLKTGHPRHRPSYLANPLLSNSKSQSSAWQGIWSFGLPFLNCRVHSAFTVRNGVNIADNDSTCVQEKPHAMQGFIVRQSIAISTIQRPLGVTVSTAVPGMCCCTTPKADPHQSRFYDNRPGVSSLPERGAVRSQFDSGSGSFPSFFFVFLLSMTDHGYPSDTRPPGVVFHSLLLYFGKTSVTTMALVTTCCHCLADDLGYTPKH